MKNLKIVSQFTPQLKQWAFLGIYCKLNAGYVNVKSIERALKKQNLECCNGKIIEHETVRLKVGDWFLCADQVIYENRPIRVVSFNEETGYLLETQDGSKLQLPEWMAKKYLKPWTIGDARNGDVVVALPPKGSEHGEQIFMFKDIGDRDYVKDAVEYHCRVLGDDFYVSGSGFMGQKGDLFRPATKEEIDFMHMKMFESGYFWSEKKKQLVSIREFENKM